MKKKELDEFEKSYIVKCLAAHREAEARLKAAQELFAASGAALQGAAVMLKDKYGLKDTDTITDTGEIVEAE